MPNMTETNLAQHIANYLTFYRDMGVMGLRLDKNPFANNGQTMGTQAAPQRVQNAPSPMPKMSLKPTAQQPAGPQPKAGPALDLIMDLLDAPAPDQSTQAIAQAVQAPDKASGLKALYKAFHKCQACALGTTRTKFVFGEGDPNASLFFVGEGPGEDEDLSGRPFVGKAGQLLDRIIEAMGFKRHEVFIANVVKCRPPNNRNPLPDEMASCSPILNRQIEIVQPQVIIALGATPLRHFVGESAGITRMRGKFIDWKGIALMPTFHPAYILRNPASKRDVWEDMKLVMARIGKEP